MNTLKSIRRGFTIVEMLVSTAVLVLIMVLIGKLFNSAVAVTGLRGKEMDVDAQARAVFDRMSIDFSQMVKRTDVDYYLKANAKDQYGNSALPQTGNDQLAFYSQVPGYYPTASTSTQQSPVSLVGYRINSSNQLQRFGFGFEWNGVQTSGDNQMIFSSGANGASCYPYSGNAIYNNWPTATGTSSPDPNYETSGPQVFRFEYYYVLKGVAGTTYTSIYSDVPWDIRQGHNSVSGLQDVAAIGVIIAVADPKSRNLVSSGTPSKLAQLAATMEDFPPTDGSGNNTTVAGAVEYSWQQSIQAAAAANSAIQFPPLAAASIRVYGRTFYLPAN